MVNSIFAKRVTVLHKNGYRQEYTHVVEFKVGNPIPKMHEEIEPYLMISGEIEDPIGQMRCNTVDKIPIKDLHTTIIDWYIPKE